MSLINTVFSLIPAEHRSATIRSVILSIIQSFLEVVSLALVVPLFYSLTGVDIELSGLKFFFLGELQWEATVAFILTVFILKNFISLWIVRSQSNFISTVSVSLSEKLYRNFYNQSWVSYIQNNSAETVRKIKTTPSDFANYILHGYIILVSETITLGLMTSVVIFYDYRVVIIILLLCLPVAIIYFFIRKKVIARIDQSFRELTPETSTILTQGVDSFAEAKIYHKEDFFIERFMKMRSRTSQQLADLKTATTLPSKLFELTALLCLCALIFYAKLTTPNQPHLIALIGLLLIAMYRIIPSLNRILITLSQIGAYAYSVSEIRSSFEVAKAQTEKPKPIIFTQQIQLLNISFQYSKPIWTIQHINLTINKGDFIVLEGSSGVGKTTLLHILAGLLYPTEGKILVDGNLVTSINGMQSIIGIVPQAPVILQDTLAKNIAFAEEGNIDSNKLHTALEIASLIDFVKSLSNGVDTSLDENGLNLSGGQRQRVALSRALYRDPEVLLLDEVTNQLDEVTKEQILKNLKALCNTGKTVIIATHDQFVKKYANQVLKM